MIFAAPGPCTQYFRSRDVIEVERGKKLFQLVSGQRQRSVHAMPVGVFRITTPADPTVHHRHMHDRPAIGIHREPPWASALLGDPNRIGRNEPVAALRACHRIALTLAGMPQFEFTAEPAEHHILRILGHGKIHQITGLFVPAQRTGAEPAGGL